MIIDPKQLESIGTKEVNESYKTYVKNKPFDFKIENSQQSFFNRRAKSHLPPGNYLSKVKYVNNLNKNNQIKKKSVKKDEDFEQTMT